MYSEILVENRRFEPTSPLFGPLGGDLFGMSLRFWHRKTRVPGLSYAFVCAILGLTVFVELRLVIDRQDKQDKRLLQLWQPRSWIGKT